MPRRVYNKSQSATAMSTLRLITSQKCHYTQPRSFRPKGLEPKLSAVFAHWLACSTWAHVFLADYTTATACKGHVTKLGSLTDTALPFRRCNASRRRWLPATTAGLLQLVGTIWPVFFQLPLPVIIIPPPP